MCVFHDKRNKHDKYRDEECMKVLNKKKMTLLTSNGNKSYIDTTNCCICQVELWYENNKNQRKVRGYCIIWENIVVQHIVYTTYNTKPLDTF